MSKEEFNSQAAINATIPSPEPRPFEIAGIPQTISRAARNALVESLGIDIKRLVALRFEETSVEIEMYALNAKGDLFIDRGTGHAARHVLSVPVVE